MLCVVSYRAFTTGTPPAPRYHHSAVVYGSSMFVFGKLSESYIIFSDQFDFVNVALMFHQPSVKDPQKYLTIVQV